MIFYILKTTWNPLTTKVLKLFKSVDAVDRHYYAAIILEGICDFYQIGWHKPNKYMWVEDQTKYTVNLYMRLKC